MALFQDRRVHLPRHGGKPRDVSTSVNGLLRRVAALEEAVNGFGSEIAQAQQSIVKLQEGIDLRLIVRLDVDITSDYIVDYTFHRVGDRPNDPYFSDADPVLYVSPGAQSEEDHYYFSGGRVVLTAELLALDAASPGDRAIRANSLLQTSAFDSGDDLYLGQGDQLVRDGITYFNLFVAAQSPGHDLRPISVWKLAGLTP